MEDPVRPSTTLYVSNLDPSVTSSLLTEIFLPFGEIISVSLPKPTLPSEAAVSSHRGFGYVEFEERNDAKEAIDNMDHSEIFGRVVKVSWARGERRDEEMAGKAMETAVWEREGYDDMYGSGAGREQERDAKKDGKVAEEMVKEDPMAGLEDLDVAGPKAE